MHTLLVEANRNQGIPRRKCQIACLPSNLQYCRTLRTSFFEGAESSIRLWLCKDNTRYSHLPYIIIPLFRNKQQLFGQFFKLCFRRKQKPFQNIVPVQLIFVCPLSLHKNIDVPYSTNSIFSFLFKPYLKTGRLSFTSDYMMITSLMHLGDMNRRNKSQWSEFHHSLQILRQELLWIRPKILTQRQRVLNLERSLTAFEIQWENILQEQLFYGRMQMKR